MYMPAESRFFNISELAKTLPATAQTLLTDIRLTDEVAASCRVFRVYRPVPAHFHTSCDEYLYVLSGAAQIAIADDAPTKSARASSSSSGKTPFMHSRRSSNMSSPCSATDTPRRPPEDVHFVNPADGTPQTFIKTQY